MKTTPSLLSLSMLALALSGPAVAADPKPAPDKKPAEAAGAVDPAAMDEAMKTWARIATPGEPHRQLAKMVGRWTATVKATMAPGAEPMVSKGTAEYRPILGGRWIAEDFASDFMGQPFTGYGLTGYDNFRQEFVSTWMDSMSTTVFIARGQASPDGKTLTFVGEMDEPTTGEKGKKVKAITRWVDDNTVVFEMWDSAGGKDWVALEITYLRAK